MSIDNHIRQAFNAACSTLGIDEGECLVECTTCGGKYHAMEHGFLLPRTSNCPECGYSTLVDTTYLGRAEALRDEVHRELVREISKLDDLSFKLRTYIGTS